MTEKEKRTHIRVTLSTAQKLSCMASILGKNRLQFVEELTNSIFEVLGSHISANLTYEARITSGILQIQVIPKETVIEMPIEPLKRILKKAEITKPIAPLKFLVPSKDTKHMQDIEIVKNEEVEKND